MFVCFNLNAWLISVIESGFLFSAALLSRLGLSLEWLSGEAWGGSRISLIPLSTSPASLQPRSSQAPGEDSRQSSLSSAGKFYCTCLATKRGKWVFAFQNADGCFRLLSPLPTRAQEFPEGNGAPGRIWTGFMLDQGRIQSELRSG